MAGERGRAGVFRGIARRLRRWRAPLSAALLIAALPGTTTARAAAPSCAICAPADAGDLSLVSRLVTLGALINLRDSSANLHRRGKTPLTLALYGRHTDIALFLLTHHADPDLTDERGISPLFIAMGSDDRASVEALIAAGADVNAANRGGVTPLMRAASWHEVDVMERLLSAHADPNRLDARGRGALDHALPDDPFGPPSAEEWKPAATLPTIALLLAAGETPNTARDMRKGEDDWSGRPMHVALDWAEKGQPALLELLLEHGASAAGIDNPLPLTALRGHPDLVKKLIDAGASVDQENARGDSALGIAVEAGDVEQSRLLLSLGADPMHPDARRAYPLDIAIRHGDAVLVRLLLRHGAPVIVPRSGVDEEGRIRHRWIADPMVRQIVQKALNPRFHRVVETLVREHGGKEFRPGDSSLRLANLQPLFAAESETPDDILLQGTVLVLAASAADPLPLPEAAQRAASAAKAAQGEARTRSAILAAATLYAEAIRLAPWVPAYYRELCTLYQRGGAYGLAWERCSQYQQVVPPDVTVKQQMDEIAQKMADLGITH